MRTSRVLGIVVAICVGLCQSRSGNATLIESFENTLDGWQVVPPSNPQAFVPGFSSTTGVTDGNYSLSITGTGNAGPNYAQMLLSPATTQLTSVLANAASVSLDVYAPPNSFGYYLQFDVDIYNPDTGYVSLGNYSYPAHDRCGINHHGAGLLILAGRTGRILQPDVHGHSGRRRFQPGQ